ncbi:MAG: hypothetical protein QGH90_06765 [Candidatus Poseidoniaceae archaeon]|jgi:hypothetical protein|nr:hypothetical protein [Candidatus Poseidoniaceae archaeon]MDP7001588.1 hypothetical protein [Candidatus Poseidoniaceae archaeon]
MGEADLPDWAIPMWEEVGSPKLQQIQPVHAGDLLARRTGLRRDDLVEIILDSRALTKGTDSCVRGRLVSRGKGTLEILDQGGDFRYLHNDVIVEIRLVAHLRPAYIDDKELLEFERADQKRRSELHEKVEKNTGRDDGHLWG